MAPVLRATSLALARAVPRTTASAVNGASLLARTYATPHGPPPTNFRTSQRVEFAWEKDGTLDKLGKYFLMTEMARGMYLLMEQFFRPPYTIYYPFEKVSLPPLNP